MELILTEEQVLLQHTAQEFVASNSSLRRIRELRDSRDGLGFSRDLWSEMGKLGWLGIIFAPEYGGAGLGYTDLMVVLEEFGRGLMPEPLLSTVLLAGNAVAVAGTPEQKEALLPPLITGDVLMALAYTEPLSRYDVHHVTTRAEKAGSGWTLSGEKVHVLDAYGADRLIVSARTSGAAAERDGITLFLLDPHKPGVSVERQWRVDGRNAGLVRLDRVPVAAPDIVGSVDDGAATLDTIIDRATIGLCAEMLGSMTAGLTMTLDYLKTRRQFGVPIGSFQALKHRAAKMFIEAELARSAVMAAHQAVDEGSPNVPQLASLAKARCSDAFILIGNEMIQMHGGIGMTDEHDVGFFFKRARAAEMTFGDAAYHRNRFAELGGY